MAITLASFWKGRDTQYAAACTQEIQVNAAETVRVINLLLAKFATDTGVVLTEVASGWRPPEINEATSNAGAKSTHLKALAVDMRDGVDRLFARWLLGNRAKLAELGLYMEDPRWTMLRVGGGWCHLQRVAPKSGNRVFIPSNKPPSNPPLSKWVRAELKSL